MKKELANTITKVIWNTNLDVDRLAKHFGISGKAKKRLAGVVEDLRRDRDKKWREIYG